MDLDRLVVMAGSGMVAWALVRSRGLAAGSLAAMLGWMYPDIAVSLGAIVFVALALLHVWRRAPPGPIIRSSPAEPMAKTEEDIIDVEFTVKEQT